MPRSFRGSAACTALRWKGWRGQGQPSASLRPTAPCIFEHRAGAGVRCLEV